MVLSEAEAEGRLAALRREREAIDRAITDLSLYLELGRRLTTVVGNAANAEVPQGPQVASPSPGKDGVREETHQGSTHPSPQPSPGLGKGRDDAGEPAREAPEPGEAASASLAGDPDPAETKSAAVLSEGALARRYGRALVREAVAVLEAAGRPLHAGEILGELSARGFSIPGQQDPVAALNTRLWKRAGPGGPLRRLGDAIYAPSERGAGEANSGTP